MPDDTPISARRRISNSMSLPWLNRKGPRRLAGGTATFYRLPTMRAELNHIRNWIFDLDNTLYPASANLFPLIDARMGEYIMKLIGCDAVEAHRIQKDYFFAH